MGQVDQCGTRLHTPEKKAGNWAGPTPIQSKRIHRSKLTVQQANWPTWNTVSSPGRISGKWKETDSEPAMMSIQQTKTSVGKRRSYVCSLPNSGNSEASPLSAATPAYLKAFTPGGWNCQQCTHSSNVWTAEHNFRCESRRMSGDVISKSMHNPLWPWACR